jgi:hypothetical protein
MGWNAGLDSRQCQKAFALLHSYYKRSVGFSLEVKQPDYDTYHTHPYRAEIKKSLYVYSRTCRCDAVLNFFNFNLVIRRSNYKI